MTTIWRAHVVPPGKIRTIFYRSSIALINLLLLLGIAQANPQLSSDQGGQSGAAKQTRPQADAIGEQSNVVPRGNLPLANQINDKAQGFVNRANDLIKQRAIVGSEVDIDIRTLTIACQAKSSIGNSSGDHQQVFNISQSAANWLNALNIQLSHLASLKNQIAAETKDRCTASLRAPGLRNERCLVLEMSEQWAIQTEQFIKLQQSMHESDEKLLSQIKQLESNSCLTKNKPQDIADHMFQVHRLLNKEAHALIAGSIQSLTSVVSTPPEALLIKPN
jgi:hypothetical protein